VGVVVDVLVNNAGYGVGGYFAGSSLRSLEDMLQVNVLAATRFCRLFLPEMLRRRDGHILNIASVGAYVPGPMNAVYCAGKAYLLHLSEALAQECRGKGVKVSAVCPWAVGTGFADRADMESTLLFNLGVLQAKEVARAAYCAMERGQTVCTVGPAAKLTAAAVRLAPRGLSARVSGILQKPR